MRISFDLDNTLICDRRIVPFENRLPWYHRILAGDEPLRLGTRELMLELQARGWEIWIYTTSYRNPESVRRWLRSYGITIGGIVNQDIHDKHLKRQTSDRPPSKNPTAFDIDLHVDDLEGVRLEGERHGFRVLVVKPEDDQWAAKVLKAAEKFRNGMD